jgi:hypothetical protein
VLENVPLDAGLQKRANFPPLTIVLAGIEDQTRATCVAGSDATRSAIHTLRLQCDAPISRRMRKKKKAATCAKIKREKTKRMNDERD